jgi:methionyl-tRNA formyltransferase
MNLVIITGTSQHHYSLCDALSRAFRISAIIHPRVAQNRQAKIKRLQRSFREHGIAGTVLNGFSRLSRLRHSVAANIARGGGSQFAAAVHSGVDVNTSAAIDLLRSFKADVAIFFGGPVYPAQFIAAAPLALNYHSGISPLYNGTQSAAFAFANGHPHLCGGTLMQMSSVVDGGGILSHYLPELITSDTPFSLFNKTAAGAINAYSSILRHIQDSGVPTTFIEQRRALFYTRGTDWTYYHAVRTKHLLKLGVPQRLARSERLIEYWKERDQAKARMLFDATMGELLWGGTE